MTQIGAVLAGRYRVLAKLGEGGMGAVFRAENLVTGKQVAIKCLHSHVTASAESSERLLREARASSSLSHPNVVDVYDVVRDGETMFLVMELLKGETLRAYLTNNPQPKISDFISLLLPALAGVAAAHASGVIHRDLKPDNIFLARVPDMPRAVVKVLDFGIAKLSVARGPTLTQTGVSLGTPLYMSLEQLRGDKDIDQRADVYAFGVMLYEAVTGRLPYEAETLPELAIKVATTDPPPVKSLRADIPTPLARLIDYAVARDRNQRMPTVRTLMQELEVFARDHTFREQMTQREAPMPRLAAETRELSGDSVTLLRDPEPARKPPPLAAAKQPGLRSDPDTFRVREVISSARPRRKRWTVGISAAIVGLLVAGVWLFNQRSQPQPTDIDAASAGAPVATPALPAPTVAAPTPLAAPGGAAELHPTPIQARPEPRAAAAKPSEPADNPEVVAAPASPPSQPAVPHKQPVAPSSPKPAVRPPTAPAPSNKISTAALPALTKPAPVTSVSKTPPAVLPPPAPAKKKSSLDLVGF